MLLVCGGELKLCETVLNLFTNLMEPLHVFRVFQTMFLSNFSVIHAYKSLLIIHFQKIFSSLRWFVQHGNYIGALWN